MVAHAVQIGANNGKPKQQNKTSHARAVDARFTRTRLAVGDDGRVAAHGEHFDQGPRHLQQPRRNNI